MVWQIPRLSRRPVLRFPPAAVLRAPTRGVSWSPARRARREGQRNGSAFRLRLHRSPIGRLQEEVNVFDNVFQAASNQLCPRSLGLPG
jgi:hypothetical protein